MLKLRSDAASYIDVSTRSTEKDWQYMRYRPFIKKSSLNKSVSLSSDLPRRYIRINIRAKVEFNLGEHQQYSSSSYRESSPIYNTISVVAFRSVRRWTRAGVIELGNKHRARRELLRRPKYKRVHSVYMCCTAAARKLATPVQRCCCCCCCSVDLVSWNRASLGELGHRRAGRARLCAPPIDIDPLGSLSLSRVRSGFSSYTRFFRKCVYSALASRGCIDEAHYFHVIRYYYIY